NASGTKITSDDDSGSEHNFKISQYLETGTYYVKVKHRDSSAISGTYLLAAHFDDYGNTPDDATPINPSTVASTVSGSIEMAGDEDWFKVDITSTGTLVIGIAGQTADDINVSLYGESNVSIVSGDIEVAGDEDWFKVVIPSAGTLVVNTTGSTDTYGYLLDANNREIESNDDGGLDRNFKISKFITTAGTYYVRVKHHSTSLTGSYLLVSQFIADDYGNARNTAATISATSTTSGNLEIAGDVDYFKIVIPSSATRKGALTVDINDTRTYTFLRDASDRQLASFHGLESNVMRPVRAGETYYVSVEGSSAAPTVRYTLTSQFTADDHGDTKETATLINPDSNTSGHITSYEDKDYFKIVIPRAGTLVVETTGA
ncbi:MAG: PPC domain-containing protein, partial [Sulfurovum sp.]|nr:PPC domain-containing protein [Sulfurovum sp.]